MTRPCIDLLCRRSIPSMRGPFALYCSRRCRERSESVSRSAKSFRTPLYQRLQFQRIARAWFLHPHALVSNVAQTLPKWTKDTRRGAGRRCATIRT
jgi:hypothetical protein